MPVKALNYRLTDIAPMLDVSDTTVRRMIDDLGIQAHRIPAGSTTRPVYTIEQVLQLAKSKRQRHRPVFRPPLVISVYVPKGGVGKSTITNELAAELSLQGFNVLAIDLDDQASLTLMMGFNTDEMPEKDKPNPWLVSQTFVSVLFPDEDGSKTARPFSQIVRAPYGEYGPKLVTADITLGKLVYILTNSPNRENAIRHWVASQANKDLNEFDIVLIDNAPSTSVVSRAAIVAADLLLVPVRLDALTVKSIGFLANELMSLSKNKLDIPQVVAVPNMFRHSSSRSARVMATLQKDFGEEVPIAPHISESERFPKSLSLLLDSGEPEQVLPVTFESWNRSFERQHQEIRAVAQYLLNIAEQVRRREDPPGLFDEPKIKQVTP